MQVKLGKKKKRHRGVTQLAVKFSTDYLRPKLGSRINGLFFLHSILSLMGTWLIRLNLQCYGLLLKCLLNPKLRPVGSKESARYQILIEFSPKEWGFTVELFHILHFPCW